MKSADLWHRLSDRDTTTMTATCQICGPDTPIKYCPSKNLYVCRIRHRQRRNPNNPSALAHRERLRQMTKAGTTRVHRSALLEAQGGLCAICKQVPNPPGQDHDHKTGTIRGVLCLGCNKGLGFFYDSPEMLEVAAAYLRQYQ